MKKLLIGLMVVAASVAHAELPSWLPKIPGAVIPRRVFTQPGSLGDIAVRRYDVHLIPEKLSLLQTIISVSPLLKNAWAARARWSK
jgi:hypothetical protein